MSRLEGRLIDAGFDLRMRGEGRTTFLQFDDTFDWVFYRGIAGGTLGLFCSRASFFFLASKHKLVAAALAHNVTTLAESHDFLVAKFFAAHLTEVLFGLRVLCELEGDQVFKLELVRLATIIRSRIWTGHSWFLSWG